MVFSTPKGNCFGAWSLFCSGQMLPRNLVHEKQMHVFGRGGLLEDALHPGRRNDKTMAMSCPKASLTAKFHFPFSFLLDLGSKRKGMEFLLWMNTEGTNTTNSIFRPKRKMKTGKK